MMRENGIDWSLHVAAAGVRLDGGVEDLEGFAEAARSIAQESGCASSRAETVAAFQNS